MARTVALLLEQLAHRHPSLEAWTQQERGFFDGTNTNSVDLVRKEHVQKAIRHIIHLQLAACYASAEVGENGNDGNDGNDGDLSGGGNDGQDGDSNGHLDADDDAD